MTSLLLFGLGWLVSVIAIIAFMIGADQGDD